MKTHFVSFETNSVDFIVYEGAMYIIRYPDCIFLKIFFFYYDRPVFLEPLLVKVNVQWDETCSVLLFWRLTEGN